jgi:hypothetical protein
MPARMACATDLNFGFSSVFLRVVANWRVKVDANHSRTSGGTASGCTSDSSSSSSAKRLWVVAKTEGRETEEKHRLEIAFPQNRRPACCGRLKKKTFFLSSFAEK